MSDLAGEMVCGIAQGLGEHLSFAVWEVGGSWIIPVCRGHPSIHPVLLITTSDDGDGKGSSDCFSIAGFTQLRRVEIEVLSCCSVFLEERK